MDGEVHVFLAKASALDGNELELPAGERYDMMFFMRQEKGKGPDRGSAEKMMSEAGWGNIEISKAGRTTLEELKEAEDGPVLIYCYDTALADGSALLIDDNPLK